MHIAFLNEIAPPGMLSRGEKLMEKLSEKYGYKFILIDLKNLKKAFRLDYDLIVASAPIYFPIGYVLSRVKRRPLIIDFRDPYLLFYSRKFFTKIILKLFRNRGNVTMVTMKAYIDEYDLDRSKVVYNPNAAPREWTELPSQKEKFQICYIGGLDNAFYNHDIAIKAVSILKDEFPQLKLVIAGDGRFKNRLERLAKDLGVQENVEFLGRIPFEDVHKVIGESMAGLALNPWLGQKEMEYAALGKPCIGLSERRSVEDMPWMVYVDPDPRDIAKKMKRLIENEDERKRLGEAGRRAVTELWNWNHIAEVWQEVIERVTGGERKDEI